MDAPGAAIAMNEFDGLVDKGRMGWMDGERCDVNVVATMDVWRWVNGRTVVV